MKKVKNKAKKIFSNLFSNIKSSPIFYIFLVTCFVFAPYISTHSYFVGHDTQYHAASIIGIEADNNIIGIFNTHILEDINQDFGNGEGIFYPQLSHHIAATILHIIKPVTDNVFLAMKATNFIGIFFSGVTMYLLMRRLTKNKMASLLSSVIYMTFPYHIGDVLVRDAFAETYFLIFMPLIFLGVYELVHHNYRRFFVIFTLGYIGSINSHLVLTMYITGFLVLISLPYLKQIINKKAIIYFAASVITVCVIVSPFLVPFIQNMRNYSYVATTPGMMMNDAASVNTTRLNFLDYFTPHIDGKSEQFHKNVPFWFNIFVMILAGLAILNYKKIVNKNNKYFITGSIAMLLISLLFSSSLIDWSYIPGILRNIQFPWRLELFILFPASILAGLMLIQMKVNQSYILQAIVILSCVLSVTSVQQVTGGGRQDLMVKNFVNRDYYPVALFSYSDAEVAARAKQGIIVVDGEADIEDVEDNNRAGLSFKVANFNSDSVTVEIPKFYSLGYTVTGKTADGRVVYLDYKDSPIGLIQVNIARGINEVTIRYTNTKLGNFARVVSTIGIIGFAGYAISIRKKV